VNRGPLRHSRGDPHRPRCFAGALAAIKPWHLGPSWRYHFGPSLTATNTQLLRQGDAKVFKKYSQMKLQMKREALKKLNRKANEGQAGFDTERPN
jgi:hypothetical protein